MQAILSRIPEKIRRVFYVLPLFIQWIIGMTWEAEAPARRPARRAMVLGLGFLLGIGLLYIVRESMAYLFSGGLDYYVGWLVFFGHTGLAGVYWIGSLYLIALEMMNRDGESWLDQLADALERRLSV